MSPDYRELFDLLDQVEKLTVKEWPAELPPETAPGFWETATRMEFLHRATLTEKIRLALSGCLQSCASWSPIEVWLYQRRMEWATQVALAAAKDGASCRDTPERFLLDVMVERWSDQGALAFWEHATERSGRPHPECDEDILKALLT